MKVCYIEVAGKGRIEDHFIFINHSNFFEYYRIVKKSARFLWRIFGGGSNQNNPFYPFYNLIIIPTQQ